MAIKFLYISMLGANIVTSGCTNKCDNSNKENIIKALKHHYSVCDNKIRVFRGEERENIETRRAAKSYVHVLCQEYENQIQIKSYEILNDVVNWFNTNQIKFGIIACGEYEVNEISDEQIESLNSMLMTKYDSIKIKA